MHGQNNYLDLSLLRGKTPLDLQHNFAISQERASGYPYDRALSLQKYSKFSFYLYGRYTGNSILQLDHKSRLISWCIFYPLDRAQNASRKGLGTIAHVKSILDISKYAKPDYTVEHSRATSLRDKHLEAMGLSKRERLETYIRKSIDYAARKGFSFNNPFS